MISSVRRRLLFLAAAPVVLAALAGCTSASNAAGNKPTATAPSATTLPPTTAPTTTPTITAPSTTAVATSTSSTTTSSTTTSSTLPPNVVVVKPSKVELKAVGGSSGPETKKVQERLVALGFWAGPIDGSYGFPTTQAVMAFQKYLGLKATGKVDTATAAYLQNFGEKSHGTADNGTLVEVDKKRQLLFIVQDSKTVWTFNTSTGSGIPYEAANKKDPTKIEKGDAVTPAGLYKTNRQRTDGWWDGDLGKIYRPKYFRGGIAIHGMTSVPNYPASHGCVRVSTMAMDFIWDQKLVPLHTVVWVHE